MKRVINGRRYDTEAPRTRLVGEASGGSRKDFSYWKAGLYQTGQGSFFLAGEGHAMTLFALEVVGLRGWGTKLIPLSAQKALAWAEENLEPELVENFFADMLEDANQHTGSRKRAGASTKKRRNKNGSIKK